MPKLVLLSTVGVHREVNGVTKRVTLLANSVHNFPQDEAEVLLEKGLARLPVNEADEDAVVAETDDGNPVKPTKTKPQPKSKSATAEDL
jgi:hypothetical protein